LLRQVKSCADALLTASAKNPAALFGNWFALASSHWHAQ
jgi:hypothetical protein